MVRFVILSLSVGFFLPEPGVRGEEPGEASREKQIAVLLVTALGEGTVQQRLNAIRELREIGEEGISALARVATESSDETVRRRAFESMDRVAEKDDPRMRAPRLLAALQRDWVTDRDGLVYFLGDDVEVFLRESVTHPAPLVRESALFALAMLELPKSEALPIFEKAWAAKEEATRLPVAVGLFRAGNRTPEVIKVLFNAIELGDAETLIRETVESDLEFFFESFARVIVDPTSSPMAVDRARDYLMMTYDTSVFRPAFAPLREALRSEDPISRIQGALQLGRMSHVTTEVVDILAREIESRGPMWREALHTVVDEEIPSARVDDVMMEWLRSDDRELVEEIIGLAAHPRWFERTRELLAGYLFDESLSLHAIWNLGGTRLKIPFKSEYIPPLAKLIREGESAGKSAMNALLNMGPLGAEAVAEIIDDPEISDDVRISLIREIGLRLDGYSDIPRPEFFFRRLATFLDRDNPELAVSTAVTLVAANFRERPLAPTLLAGWVRDDETICARCEEALTKLTWERETIVSALLEIYESEDFPRRTEILKMLTPLAGDSPEVVDLLVGYLLNETKSLRFGWPYTWPHKRFLAERLAKLTGEGEPEARHLAIEELYTLLRSPSPATINNKWKQVEGTDPPPGVRQAIRSEDHELRTAAVLLLHLYEPQSEVALPILLEMLEHKGHRRSAIFALRRYRQNAEPALPTLRSMLDDADEEQLFAVLTLIQALGPKAAPLVPKLIELLPVEANWRQDDLFLDDLQIADALASIGEAAKPAETALIEMLSEEKSLQSIGNALRKISGSTDELVAEIDRRLEDPVLRYQAVKDLQVLSQIEPITPRLRQIFAGDDLALKLEAAQLLAVEPFLRDPIFIEPLKALRESEFAEIRRVAVSALEEQGGPADLLLETLKEDENSNVRAAAAMALGKRTRRVFGRVWSTRFNELEVWEAIPVLQDIIQQPSEDLADQAAKRRLQIQAVHALAEYGMTARQTLPSLLRLLEDLPERRLSHDEENWKDALLTAIWSIDPETAFEKNLDRPTGRKRW